MKKKVILVAIAMGLLCSSCLTALVTIYKDRVVKGYIYSDSTMSEPLPGAELQIYCNGLLGTCTSDSLGRWGFWHNFNSNRSGDLGGSKLKIEEHMLMILCNGDTLYRKIGSWFPNDSLKLFLPTQQESQQENQYN